MNALRATWGRLTLRAGELYLLVIPLLAVLVGLTQVALVEGGPPGTEQLIAAGVLWGALLSVHLVLLWRRPAADQVLLALVAALLAISLTMVARVAPDLLPRQALWIALGTLALLGVLFWPRRLTHLAAYKYTYAFLALLLVAVTLVFGHDPNASGARLWLQFGPITFQPSELLKVLLVAFLAAYLAEKRELLILSGLRIGPIRLLPPAYTAPLLIMMGISLALLGVQGDLGAGLLLFGIFVTMLYLATGRKLDVLLGLGLFAVAALIVVRISARASLRLDVWLDPYADPQGAGYQVIQGMLGLAWGGVFGQGLGYGIPELIPAAHTDFPLAAIGEEMGLAGTLAVIGLYVLLSLRGWMVAVRTRHPFLRLLAAGLTTIFALQSWIIMAGTLRVMPLTGITLPFVSYGGSSLLMNFLVLGMLLRISASAPGE